MTATKPPSGTRDFLPDDVRRREYVIGVIREVYERYGFEPLETPAFENIETLLGKYGEEGNKLIFKILRRGEHEERGDADLALRYDLTVPLARVVAQYQNELPKFFKRYQIQPVWRADRPARGRFREFFQCDIDSIGSTSPVVEAEELGAVVEILRSLGFVDFRILLNHRQILTGLLVVAGVPSSQHEAALIALDKRDKIGEAGVASEFAARGIDAQSAERLFTMLREFYTPSSKPVGLVNADRFTSLDGYLGTTEYSGAVDNLREIVRLVKGTSAAEYVNVDPRLARGLSYYTGAIMEIAVPDLAGSLGGGGRYDNLIGLFLGRDVPACGFSLGLERIIVVMTERNMFPTDVVHRAVDVMITMWNEDTRGDALALASDLRRAGLRVDVYPEAEKLGKQFKYAATRRVRFVAILGDDERAQGNVSIKDLGSSEQQTVARAEAGAFIKQRIEANG
ncbi:MAG: histidine--tRNA ligase [Acidobacteria bacterium RIFCSPLOWO2_12_FULL_65_11]|nr:MAG: histidine--tRNA ligase [Acidobacteria bacterium RIFCSPLOWO2_02_FULL_64_15]OFW28506.1 MAG: histidine--tRNA ligase [Acidobacteria bacterium RIFCSPLOWO2_12_FULL_65_11]